MHTFWCAHMFLFLMSNMRNKWSGPWGLPSGRHVLQCEHCLDICRNGCWHHRIEYETEGEEQDGYSLAFCEAPLETSLFSSLDWNQPKPVGSYFWIYVYFMETMWLYVWSMISLELEEGFGLVTWTLCSKTAVSHLSCLECRFWNSFPLNIKSAQTLSVFRTWLNLRSWACFFMLCSYSG